MLSISSLKSDHKLPPGISEDNLKQFIETQCRVQGKFNSIDLNYKQKKKKYICLAYFGAEENAKKAVEIFNKIEIDDLKLIAEYIVKQPDITNVSNEKPPMESGIKFKNKEEKKEKKISER